MVGLRQGEADADHRGRPASRSRSCETTHVDGAQGEVVGQIPAAGGDRRPGDTSRSSSRHARRGAAAPRPRRPPRPRPRRRRTPPRRRRRRRPPTDDAADHPRPAAVRADGSAVVAGSAWPAASRRSGRAGPRRPARRPRQRPTSYPPRPRGRRRTRGRCRGSVSSSSEASIASASPIADDLVRRGVGHAVEADGVALALDAGGGDDALALDGDGLAPARHMALTTAWMSCWWTTRSFWSRSVASMQVLGGVVERDLDRGPGARGEPGRVGQRVDLVAGSGRPSGRRARRLRLLDLRGERRRPRR